MIMKKEIPLRRFWAACLCLALMITAAGDIAYAQSNEAAVVYISDSGNDSNDGSSVQTAVKTWEKAYELVPDESKIIVAGTSTVPDSFVPLSEKTVTISGDYDETDERGTLIPGEASMTALSFGADTVMENLMPGIICKSVGDNFCILAALDLYGVSGFGLRWKRGINGGAACRNTWIRRVRTVWIGQHRHVCADRQIMPVGV